MDRIARDEDAIDALDAKPTHGDINSMHQALARIKQRRKYCNNKTIRIEDSNGSVATSTPHEKRMFRDRFLHT